MLLFRSEEHLNKWLVLHGGQRGAVLTLAETWRLAQAWYPDRRDPAWRPRTREESQAVLPSAGRNGSFWTLAP